MNSFRWLLGSLILGVCAISLQAESPLSIALDGNSVLRIGSANEKGPQPELRIEQVESNLRRIQAAWTLDSEQKVDELSLRLDFLQNPDFHWLPHLTPSEGFVVGQHVFRSPAIVTADSSVVVAIIPDLDLVGKDPDLPWFLDMDAEKQVGWIGFAKTEIPLHVGFKKTPGLTVGPGKIELSFYVLAYRDSESPLNPWREVTKFLWNKWGRPLYQTGEPGTVPMDVYVRRTYEWAFESWADSVWQEFEINGTRVGAPQFIVNISQSPNYPGTWYQREFLSIWNQAWFSSLRSATGLARWAIRTEDNGLLEKANLTKALALSAPMNNGIFPSVIRTDNLKLEVEGKTIDRPEPWSEGYWSNSNRAPSNYGIDQDWYHLLDSSWTALLMLRWFEEIEEDHALLEYAKEYADKLVSLQDKDGFFPGWLNPETLEPGSVMNRTPESSLSATFLFKLWDLNGEQRHLEAGLKAVDAVLEEIVPEGRWEDFETYWSCCQFWNDQVGEKIPRNDQYKQNTLSMFWTAEALLEAYRQTEDEKYLNWGVRTLDELSMYQQVWQPPFIYIPAFGGFGVMNFDGEWNDSRESLFAELYLDYYAITGNRDYFERGVAALKSSFVMMYCPENPKQKVQWEKAHPFFGPEDYGFTMENYGHGGETSPEGMGMGVFTIYDWGNGAASEARNRIHDHYGDVYIDRERGEAFGIDSISVTKTDQGWSLENLSATPRELRVVFEDGSSKDLSIEKKTMLKADE